MGLAGEGPFTLLPRSARPAHSEETLPGAVLLFRRRRCRVDYISLERLFIDVHTQPRALGHSGVATDDVDGVYE